VLNNFAKADAAWLEPLLDAIAEAAPRLAAGEDARFLTDVARATTKPATVSAPAPASSAMAPTGERQAKRASALAETLKRWLKRREKS
jgi:peptidyl-tRNA hydrolase, PTH1 family